MKVDKVPGRATAVAAAALVCILCRPVTGADRVNADGESGSPRFADVQIEAPYDRYLLANPLLMEVSGAKAITRPDGTRVLVAVASTPVKDGSPADRLRAERVCLAKALANLVGEQHGVQVARVEESSERTTVLLEDGREKVRSLSDLLQVTRTKVEGVARGAAVVGRWRSGAGDLYYLAVGTIVDGKGDPVEAPATQPSAPHNVAEPAKP